MTNAPQEMIAKHRIIASLASGSQGTVYRAYDPTPEREVALKVLHPHLATPDVVERFRREGRIVASISHPNIAGISEIGEHNGSHFIAIEYVPHAASELVGAARWTSFTRRPSRIRRRSRWKPRGSADTA